MNSRPTVEQVWTALRGVEDPEFPLSLVDMGMIYDVEVDEKKHAKITMTLTSPACPVAGTLPPEVEEKVHNTEGVSSAKVDLVWDPPWTQAMLSEAAKLQLGLL